MASKSNRVPVTHRWEFAPCHAVVTDAAEPEYFGPFQTSAEACAFVYLLKAHFNKNGTLIQMQFPCKQ